jgi:hypothetical protein
MHNLLHTMPYSNEEVRDQVEAVFGFCPCLWQICVVHAILHGDDITIAPMRSRKSMTYQMPLLFIKMCTVFYIVYPTTIHFINC